MSNRLNRICHPVKDIIEWYNENPILEKGEIALIGPDGIDAYYVSEKPMMKVGDGISDFGGMLGIKLDHTDQNVCSLNDYGFETEKRYVYNSNLELYPFAPAAASGKYLFKLSDYGIYLNLMKNLALTPSFCLGMQITLPGYITNIGSTSYSALFYFGNDILTNVSVDQTIRFIPINNANATEVKELRFYLAADEQMLDPATGRADLYFYMGIGDDGFQTLQDVGAIDSSGQLCENVFGLVWRFNGG